MVKQNQSNHTFTIEEIIADVDRHHHPVIHLSWLNRRKEHIFVEQLMTTVLWFNALTNQEVGALICLRRSLLAHQQMASHQNDLDLVLAGDYYSARFYAYLVETRSVKRYQPVLKGLEKYDLATGDCNDIDAAIFTWFKQVDAAKMKEQGTELKSQTFPLPLIDSESDFFNALKHALIIGVESLDTPLKDNLIELLISGKQLRPLLVYLTHGEVNLSADALKLAVVVEYLHTASLIHDDIIDQANTRREGQALHRRVGNLEALKLGNYLFTQSLLVLTDINNDQIHRCFSQLMVSITTGECDQQALRYQTDVSLRSYLRVINNKTAMFIRTVSEASALLMDVSSVQLKHLRLFGEYFGMSYQIKDDLKDVLADGAAGKDTRYDLQNGFLTMPYLMASQTTQFRENLQLYFKTGDPVIEASLQSGEIFSQAVDATEKWQRHYLNKSMHHAKKLNNHDQRQAYLRLCGLLLVRIKR